jgi:CheY-like chemotaxis protein
MAGPHILVVDDDQALLENVAECLADEGYEVSVARDASAALARLAVSPRPALVIADHYMPGMNGVELLAAIRRDPALASVRLVLVSGLPPHRGHHGAHAVLGKPFGVDQLVATVRSQLARDR